MIRKIALSALIAALYYGLTIVLAPLSFGPIQFRVSEAMTLLPFIVPEAITGLFVGCAIANLAGGFGLIDIIVGSLTTFAAAWLTYKMPNIWLAALPPVLLNGVIVGWYLAFLTGTPIYLSIIYIALSEAVICFGLGIPLCKFVKNSGILKKLTSNPK